MKPAPDDAALSSDWSIQVDTIIHIGRSDWNHLPSIGVAPFGEFHFGYRELCFATVRIDSKCYISSRSRQFQ